MMPSAFLRAARAARYGEETRGAWRLVPRFAGALALATALLALPSSCARPESPPVKVETPPRPPPPPQPPPLAAVVTPPVPDTRAAPRRAPRHFPANTHLPPLREVRVSGYLEPERFRPDRDLVRVCAGHVWWESEHGRGGEDDHLMNRCLVTPFTNLVRLVEQRRAVLEVRDAYRPEGPHDAQSLHKEGRAIDVTCRTLSLEQLACLCWLAGFDWVFHEGKPHPHVHCSVRWPPLALGSPPPPSGAPGMAAWAAEAPAAATAR